VNGKGEPADKSYLTFHWLRARETAGLVDFKWRGAL
jgi:hypothetical protein